MRLACRSTVIRLAPKMVASGNQLTPREYLHFNTNSNGWSGARISVKAEPVAWDASHDGSGQ